jgi:hypothetical protein
MLVKDKRQNHTFTPEFKLRDTADTTGSKRGAVALTPYPQFQLALSLARV